MTDVFGTFLLKKKNGRYAGEFFNNHMKQFASEEVNPLTVSDHDPFIGTFDTGWQEDSGAVSAVLEIDKEEDDIYMLSWKEVRLNGELRTVNFTGRGVIRNEMLICVYHMNSNPQ